MSLTVADIENIERYYPRLQLTQKDGKQYLIGEFRFNAFYDISKDELTLNPPDLISSHCDFISDAFQLEIELLSDFPLSLPLVREIGGRINNIAKKYSITDIRDLHVNKNQNNAVCLCPKPAEHLRYPHGVDPIHFLNNLVVPFFYGVSFYEKYHGWPWKEYSHGELGIFEFFAECQDKQDSSLAKKCYDTLGEQYKKIVQANKEIKGHWPCLCNSGQKFRSCHGIALKGLWALKQWWSQCNKD